MTLFLSVFFIFLGYKLGCFYRWGRYDALTGLPTWSYGQQLLQSHLSRKGHHSFCVCVLSICGFKKVNASLGYAQGDQLIIQIVERLKHLNVVRLWGNTLAVFFKYAEGPEDVIGSIIRGFDTPFDFDGRCVFVGVYVGVSLYPNDGQTASELFTRAEIAMYTAKRQGMNQYALYTPAMEARASDDFWVENELQTALEKAQFEIFFHPQVSIKTGELRGIEALVRWKRSDGTSVSPQQFIPLLEDSGLILQVGAWIFEEACLQAKKLMDTGCSFKNLAINISAVQLKDPHFVTFVDSVLEKTQFPAEQLELEITESFLMDHYDWVIHVLNELKARGIAIALDDFGTGFSSLQYLKNLPIQYLKIDQSFLKGLTVKEDTQDQRLLKAMIALAHSLSLETIVEGVEFDSQIQFLKDYGCDIIQGYYLTPPLSFSDLTQWVAVREAL
jgi:diguanylate cyclase (GGDEF)-like protein